MSDTVTITKLIAALRDTAEKATATETVQVPNPGYQMQRGYAFDEKQTIDETTLKHSRDWIAGRLLGMADTLEAMISETPTPST